MDGLRWLSKLPVCYEAVYALGDDPIAGGGVVAVVQKQVFTGVMRCCENGQHVEKGNIERFGDVLKVAPVSYTHLTLPTKA